LATLDRVLSRRDLIVYGLCIVVPVLVFYLWAVTFNIANYYPVSGDEAIIMSTSHKLATEGLPGSDLATGLHGGERTLFLNLPVHNVIQAMTFLILGTGVSQARLPSAVAGVATILLTAWCAWRWFGSSVALTTAMLLVFWRSNLIGSDPRPPLLALGQTARYDLVVVALLWMTIALLDRLLERRSRATALLTGLVAGLATLTQFYGIAAALLVAAAFLHRWRAAAFREPVTRWAAAGWLAVILPYVVFAGVNAGAFIAQASSHGARVRFLDLSFWITNLLTEHHRYAFITDRTTGGIGDTLALSPWMVWFGAMPGIAVLARRPVPLLALVVPVGVLALADQTKAALYASLLVPIACVALACAIERVMRPSVARGLRMAVAIILAVLAVESYRGYELSLRAAANASPYRDVGLRMAAFMSDDQPAMGSWRWWWALQPRRYFGVNGFRWHAERLGLEGTYPSLEDEAREKRVAYLLVDGDFAADLGRTTAAYRDESRRYLDTCTAIAGTVDAASYGRIEVRRINTGCTVR
jgi:4-amino-4-deoxy-L-arabinose transferase-like glycosyltransferase